MAELFQWSDEQQREWDAWVESRPPTVQHMARRLPPNRLYRLTTTDQHVTICSYSEDGTLTVDVSGDYNFVTFERRVFGIDPRDLEETELPPPDEVVGSVGLTIEEVKQWRRWTANGRGGQRDSDAPHPL